MWFSKDELYHPIVVHLPIATALIWLTFELSIAFYRKKRREMDFAFVVLAVVGAISAFAANLTGEMAEHVHQQTLAAPLMAAIEHHAEIAAYVVWFYLLLTVISGIIMFANFEWLRVLRFGVACGLAIVVGLAAHRGGSLVYEHGIAVGVEKPVHVPLQSKGK